MPGSLAPNEIKDLQSLDPQTKLIKEKDVYRLIMRSNKLEAEKFQDWVYDVITEIRKTGSYSLKPMTLSEQLLMSVQLTVELEKRQKETESKVKELTERLDNIDSAVDYFTIIGYFKNKKGNNIPLSHAARLGKEVTKYCNQNNIAMGLVPDPRFGNVNSYPLWVLDLLYP